jgi:hypothetical protein
MSAKKALFVLTAASIVRSSKTGNPDLHSVSAFWSPRASLKLVKHDQSIFYIGNFELERGLIFSGRANAVCFLLQATSRLAANCQAQPALKEP